MIVEEVEKATFLALKKTKLRKMATQLNQVQMVRLENHGKTLNVSLATENLRNKLFSFLVLIDYSSSND